MMEAKNREFRVQKALEEGLCVYGVRDWSVLNRSSDSHLIFHIFRFLSDDYSGDVETVSLVEERNAPRKRLEDQLGRVVLMVQKHNREVAA